MLSKRGRERGGGWGRHRGKGKRWKGRREGGREEMRERWRDREGEKERQALRGGGIKCERERGRKGAGDGA